MPSSTTKAKATKSRLLARKAPSRLSGASIPPGERSRSPRQAMSPTPTDHHQRRRTRAAAGPMVECGEGVHRLDHPRPGEEGAEDGQAEGGDHQREVPDPQQPAALLRPSPSADRRCRTSQGRNDAFSTGSQAQNPPQPSTWYDHQAPSRMPDGEERPGEQGPAPGLALPVVVQPPGDQRGDGEGEGQGEPDQARGRAWAGGRRPAGCPAGGRWARARWPGPPRPRGGRGRPGPSMSPKKKAATT